MASAEEIRAGAQEGDSVDHEQFERGANIAFFANEIDPLVEKALGVGMEPNDIASTLEKLAAEVRNKKRGNN